MTQQNLLMCLIFSLQEFSLLLSAHIFSPQPPSHPPIAVFPDLSRSLHLSFIAPQFKHLIGSLMCNPTTYSTNKNKGEVMSSDYKQYGVDRSDLKFHFFFLLDNRTPIQENLGSSKIQKEFIDYYFLVIYKIEYKKKAKHSHRMTFPRVAFRTPCTDSFAIEVFDNHIFSSFLFSFFADTYTSTSLSNNKKLPTGPLPGKVKL